MTRKSVALLAACAAVLSSGGLAPVPADATTTQTKSCVDGGGATWTVRSRWGQTYRSASGATKVSNESTGFTTAAAAATTVDYFIRSYDGHGRLLNTTGAQNRAFSFSRGTRYLNRGAVRLPSAPGRAKIVVRVGDGNDGRANCSVTFVQPGAPTKAPVRSASAMPVGDLPGWHQIFTDDFRVQAPRGTWIQRYGARWRAYPEPWRDTSKHGMYSPKRVLSANNGILDMWLHSEKGQPYVAAPEPRINGKGPRGQTYGRYSVRFRVPRAIPGYKTAWLLWPDSGRRAEGELDFPEGNLSAGSKFHAYAHDVQGTHSHNAFAATGATYTNWHVATIEWKPTGVRYFLDGRSLGTAPRSGTPRTSMHWLLQTETALGAPAPSPSVSGHVQVDWVAVYRRA